MATGTSRQTAILRDARKRALPRMRSKFFTGSRERGREGLRRRRNVAPPRNCTPSQTLFLAGRRPADSTSFQHGRTDVTKAFIVFAAVSGLTIAAALAQAPERPGASATGPGADSTKPGSSQIVDAQG